MKPNNKQKLISNIIKTQALFWLNTNDINSPTHSCDVEEEINNHVLFNKLNDDEANELKEMILELYYFLKAKH